MVNFPLLCLITGVQQVFLQIIGCTGTNAANLLFYGIFCAKEIPLEGPEMML